jgi:hypothetical protein
VNDVRKTTMEEGNKAHGREYEEKLDKLKGKMVSINTA